MRIELMLTVIFLVSSLCAQTGLVSFNQLKAEPNLTVTDYPVWFNKVLSDETAS